MHRSHAGLVVVLVILFAAATLDAKPRHANLSANYSGYERTGAVFTVVTASWQVPLIAFGTQKHVVSTSAEWIGIGGVVSALLVQVGTVHQLDAGGFRTYEAFYEFFPAGEVQITAGRVLPGDVIMASVRCISHCTPSESGQTWNLAIADVTQHWQWSRDFAFVSDLSSAEIIAENSTETGRRMFALPDFGTVTFKNIAINGAAADLKPSERVWMRASGGGTASPSVPNDTRDGFNICWGDGHAFTDCPATTLPAGDP